MGEAAPPGGSGRVRALLVTHSLSGGGAERFAATLATHLSRSRFAPSLASATPRTGYAVPLDVPVATLGYRTLLDLPRALLHLRRLLASAPPDVVLSNVLSTNCLAGGALATLAHRPPWVARVGLAPEHGEPRLQTAWARRVYPLAAALVCNSRGMVAAFAARYPRVADRCLAIPNPTDFGRIEELAAAAGAPPRRPGEPILLAVGRLTRQKRPDLLVGALAELRRRVPARLWLAGEGPLAGEVRRLAGAAGVADAIDLLGFCDNPFPLMRAADLFLLASDYEGLPNALIEAQGLGLPAVATRCPYGPEEVVEDGATGRLVAPGDAAALAAAAAELLADEPRRRAMGQEAAHLARERFSLAAVVPRWEDLLAGVAAAGPRGVAAGAAATSTLRRPGAAERS